MLEALDAIGDVVRAQPLLVLGCAIVLAVGQRPYQHIDLVVAVSLEIARQVAAVADCSARI